MINEKIVPISPYGFRFPTETEMAIDETLKLCGISGEDASMIAIEVMKKLGKSDETSACCRGLAAREDVETRLMSLELEREKGRWIPVDSYSAFGGDEATWMAHGNPVAFYYCSECKKQAYAGEDGESLLTDYCPNCGADMRGR